MKLYHQIRSFEGLANRRNARDIGNGLLKAQNISVDVGGLIKTIGGLETHSEVPTHAAVLCPGSGLYPYGSDHWRGSTETTIDIIAINAATDSAVSDLYNEVNDVGPWELGSGTLTSVADTDGTTITTNYTSWILKAVMGDNFDDVTDSTNIDTVAGQRYVITGDLYNKDATRIGITISDYVSGEILYDSGDHTAASWSTYSGEFIALGAFVEFTVYGVGSTGKIYYMDKFYISKLPARDLDTTWLALADVANAQIDLYNSRDDSFATNLLEFGTVASFVGASAGNVDFPTDNTITDSANSLLNSNLKEGRIYKISGCSTTTANNILCGCTRVTKGIAYFRGHPFTVTAAEAGTVTLTEYNPTDFHFVDDSLSVSPIGGGIALRPKQYRFVDRVHLSGAGSSEDKYQDWYLNDIGLPAPTDISAVANNGDEAMGDIGSAGTGLEIGITTTADDGEWLEGTYIIALSFMYNDGEESELYIPSTDEEFGTTIVDNDSLTLTVRALGPYDERINGARFYCRLDETDEPWSLLADVSMADGGRATLSGQYNAWSESSTVNVAYTANFVSKRINIDTYESLTGFNPDVRIEKFTSDNRFYDASVIAGNRTFIFGPRYTDAGGKTVHFRDRILFSKINEYDVFPIANLIDVTGSDAEDFVAGAVYGNDLLCFKQNTLYIVDISDPLLFRMKPDQQQGKYPFRGISRPAAMFDTPHGIAWVNQWGMWLYNGAEILDLLGDKIERSKYPLKHERYIHCDGSDDTVIKDSATILPTEYPVTLEVWFRTTTDSGLAVIVYLGEKDTNNDWFRLDIASGKIGGGIRTGGADDNFSSAGTYNDGEWHHAVLVFTDATDREIIIDGVSDGTDTSSTAVPATVDRVALAHLARSTAANYFEGNLKKAVIWNRALSVAEALARFNGSKIAFADKDGDDTELIDTTNDRTFGGAGNWSAVGGGSPSVTVNAGKLDIVVGDANTGGRLSSTKTGGTYNALKRYRVKFDISSLSAGTVTIRDNTLGSDLTTGLTDGAGQTFEFIASSGTGGIQFVGTNSGATFSIDNISIKQIGAVVAYLQENIPSTHDSGVWPDASDNDLDGVLNGATPILPDTWEDFWTDYSILGYYGRTNQLIVMRDCTGHYSLNSDYGDGWILDLDTLFVTTGRRIFTAKVAYTNFATDWNGDLIIGRQSGSNIITEKWTDKPQSQAAGLIHIETADMDFGNPAIIDIIDAFTSTYKSSAAQTNPIYYALDGTDTWTAISANFSAAEIWAKYLAEPTAFNCNTIRLRITNPTAGTIEINELIIRHDPQLLKLS